MARIRKTLKGDQIRAIIEEKARNVITRGSGLFHVEHDVSLPEHLPDGKGMPVLRVVSPVAESVDVEAMVTTKGVNKPREQQNPIFILVPKTVAVQGLGGQEGLFSGQDSRARDEKQRIEAIARQVKAIRLLKDKLQNYGINPRRLKDEDFEKRYSERVQALNTAVQVSTPVYITLLRRGT